jgi:hypothetical protein
LSLFGITNYFENDVAYKALVKVTLMIMAREGKRRLPLRTKRITT